MRRSPRPGKLAAMNKHRVILDAEIDRAARSPRPPARDVHSRFAGATTRPQVTRVTGPRRPLRRWALPISCALLLLVGQLVLAATASADLVASEGQPFTGTVAQVTPCPVSGYAIAWGDGTTSTGSADGNGGVTGTHTYAQAGTYTGQLSWVCETSRGLHTAPFTATVQDVPLTVTGHDLSGVAGQSLHAVLVAHIDDANPDAGAGDYSVQVNWGDGSQSDGTIAVAAGGGFNVTGTHTYAAAGSFSATVPVADIGGSTATATFTATISGAGTTTTSSSTATSPTVSTTATTTSTPAAALQLPAVTHVAVIGTLVAGRQSMLSAQTTGAVSRLNWDVNGDGKPDVSCDGRQSQLGFTALAAGQRTVTVTAVAPDGVSASMRVSLAVAGAPAIVAKTAGEREVEASIMKTIASAPPSYDCVPPRGVSFNYQRPVALGVCLAPSTVHVAGLEISGCLQPLTSPAQVPAGERAILNRLAPDTVSARRGPFGGGTLSLAVLLGHAYRANAPIVVNGLQVSPQHGSAVLVLPLVRQLGGSDIRLAVGDLALQTPQPGSILNLGSNGAGQIPLGRFARLPDLPSALKSIASFGLVGDVDVALIPGTAAVPAGATVTVHLKLPDFLSVAGVSLQGTVTLRATTDRGLILDNLTIGPLEANIGGIGIDRLQLTYTRATDEWFGQGRACIVDGVCLDMSPPNGGVLIRHGRLNRVSISVVFPYPGITLFSGVNLAHIGIGFGLDPTRFLGSAGLLVAGLVTIDGNLVLAFPSAAEPFILRHDEAGDAFPAAFYTRSYTDPTLAIGAEASVAIPDVGAVRLGGGYVLYEFPDYIGFGGNLEHQDFLGVLSIDGGVNGEVNFSNGRFNIGGTIHACIADVVCAGAIINVSSRGAGGCAELLGLNVGGGIEWNPLTVKLWPFDGCKWSRFAETNIFGPRLGAGRARTAQSAPFTVHIAKGNRSRAIELDGSGAAPRVRVSGPGGLSFDSPAGAGLAINPRVRVMRSLTLKTTVVGLVDPVPGDYTLTLDAGSAAVAKVSEATDPSNAKITATVRGSGATRTLSYAIAPRPDQTVTFVEQGASAARPIATVTGGRGTLHFTPAPGIGSRTIMARFTLAGLPAENITVAHFAPPSPRLARPAAVRVKRSGTRVLLRWSPVAGATSYDVVVTDAGGAQRLLHTRASSLTIAGADRTVGGRVSVRGMDTERTGASRSARYRALARPVTPRIERLR